MVTRIFILSGLLAAFWAFVVGLVAASSALTMASCLECSGVVGIVVFVIGLFLFSMLAAARRSEETRD
jgi:hypothetical protein